MAGFLQLDNNKKSPTIKREAKRTGCETCAMFRQCNTPKIQPKGDGKILIIFGNPSPREDRSGKPYNEAYQKYLYSIFERYGVSQDSVTVAHAVQCHQKDISPKAIEGCHYRLMQIIDDLEPERIFVADGIAMRTLYFNRQDSRLKFNNYKIFTGNFIPDQDLGCMVIPLEDPKEALEELIRRKNGILKYKEDARFSRNLWEDEYLAKTDSFVVIDTMLKNQVRTGLRAKWKKYKPDYYLTTDVEEACGILRKLLQEEEVAFDIETNGLSGVSSEHKIYHWGFKAKSHSTAYAFPHFEDKKFNRLIRKFLISDVKKVGANIAYEHRWMMAQYGVEVENWSFDVMIAAHCLHNQPGRTSLKYLSAMKLGIFGYDAGADQFLKSDRSSHSVNNIHLIPTNEVLQYVADDAWNTYLIAEMQRSEFDMDPYIKEGYKLFHEGQLTLAHMYNKGIPIDMVQMEKNFRKMEKLEYEAHYRIMNSEIIKRNWKKGEVFNPGSGDHLRTLLYDIMEFPIMKYTNKGLPSTDSETISEFAETSDEYRDLLNDISEYSIVQKIKNTFLRMIKRETYNGVMHVDHGLNSVISFRSSGSFMNAPKRSELAMKTIRSCFRPSKGWVILDVDYSSLEVRMGCSITGDPQLKADLLEPGSDPHSTTAQDLCLVTENDVEPKLFKEFRAAGKKANFSCQYGGGYKSIAKNLWQIDFKKPHKDYLKSKGITTFEEWEDHVKEWWTDYWENRYGVMGEWRNSVWEDFVKTGQVYSKTGFRYTARTGKNSLLNSPIQGPGFHMLMFALNESRKEFKKRGLRAYAFMEIHDAAVFHVPEEELDEVLQIIKEVFIEKLMRKYDWIDVPMGVEAEVFRVNWSETDEDPIVMSSDST